jgi:hypothetical protein
VRSHALLEPPVPDAKRAATAPRPARGGVLQAKLGVGAPGDAYEHEADNAAEVVVRALPARPIALDVSPLVQRAPGDPAKKEDDDDKRAHLQKKVAEASSEGAFAAVGVPERVEAQIAAMSAGGEQLPRAERAFFEERFGYDFRNVRVHTGPGVAEAATALNARAFTVGQHIFFGSGEYRPRSVEGRRLVAHELTHTIQQSLLAGRAGRVQRGLLDQGKEWVLGKIRELAVELPGYRLLTVLLARDPITDEPVERSAVNLIHGVLEFVPGGEEIFQNLQASKAIEQFVAFFDEQVQQLNLSWETVKSLFRQAWDALDFTDIVDPAGAWQKLKAIFAPPLSRLKTFAVNIGAYIIDAIKKKVLEWLREWASKIPGYPLLTFILGKDPFTDEPVQRTATAFVKAVLSLVPGGDHIFENLQKSHTIERTVEWLSQEIAKLDLTWEKIKALFRRAWDVISISDLLHPLAFVEKIRDIFEPPAIRVMHFVAAVGRKVLEFIFAGAMLLAGPLGHRIVGIFEKAAGAFSTIVADPVAFLGHLLDVVKLGFKQFVARIGEYLEEGVVAWLTGALEGAGITLPKTWDLKGVLSLVLQILGITYAKIRLKLVKVLGAERVTMLERVWAFLATVVTEGPTAAWHQITQALGNFWAMVIGGIKNWAVTKIITAAVTELLTLFNPVGAVIEAIIEIYRTVSFFVQHISQILMLVEAIVDSIANIAAGKIAAAAAYVEKTLARTIPVVIGFLASLIGLGDVSEGIRETIEAIQQRVDAAIDTAIDWIVQQVKSLFGEGDRDKKDGHDEKWDAAVTGVQSEYEKLRAGPEGVAPEALARALPAWKSEFAFESLDLESRDEALEIVGAMSEKKTVKRLPLPIKEEDLKDLPSWVQVARGGGWYAARLLEMVSERIDNADVKMVKIEVGFPKSPTVIQKSTLEGYGVSWRKYVAGTSPVIDPSLWGEIKDKDEWKEYDWARQVLNYRYSDGDSFNNPPGQQWHHIHEQNAEPKGPNSVENLALTTAVNNQRFNFWFDKPQSDVFTRGKSGDPLPSTGLESLRDWLRGKSNDVHYVWGLACIYWHGLHVEPKSNSKGPWQELE